MKPGKKVQATVLTTFEMPEGAVEDSDGESDKDVPSALETINLTYFLRNSSIIHHTFSNSTPLRPGEELPRQKHYEPTGKVPEAKKPEKKERTSKSGKKRSKKSKEQISPSQVTANLIDIGDDFDILSSPPSAPPAPPAASAAPSSTEVNYFIDTCPYDF